MNSELKTWILEFIENENKDTTTSFLIKRMFKGDKEAREVLKMRNNKVRGSTYQSWVITIPRTVKWDDYQLELDFVKKGDNVLNYHLPFKVNANPGDRCYILWRGEVRGWMKIVGVVFDESGFKCAVTGKEWEPGWYLQRSGPFHGVKSDGLWKMRGFRGIRHYDAKQQVKNGCAV